MKMPSLLNELRQAKNHSVRSWHLWVGVILALPMLIVGLTAVLIAHDKALGLKQVELGSQIAQPAPAELRQLLPMADGRIWVASKQGLWLQEPGGASRPVTGPGELRSLASDGVIVLAGGRNGLWRLPLAATQQPGELRAERVLKADVWGVSSSGQSWVVNSKQELFRSAADALVFSRDQALESTLARLPVQSRPELMTASKLVMDLHTGKFFFGKQGEWVWIDVLGGSLALFTLSGLLLWLRRERAQARMRSQQAPQPEGLASRPAEAAAQFASPARG